MDDLLRKLRIKLENAITRVVVDRSETPILSQVLWGGGRVSSGVEHLEPQGIHFRVPADAGGACLAPSGVRDGAFLLCAGGVVPDSGIGEGEGGLHYLGQFKVFLAADGTVHLGAEAAPDFAALASKVDAALAKLQQKLDTHTHQVATTGSATAQAGTAAPITPLVGPLASVASTVVRCT